MSLRSYARRRMVVLDPAPAASAGATFARNVSPEIFVGATPPATAFSVTVLTRTQVRSVAL